MTPWLPALLALILSPGPQSGSRVDLPPGGTNWTPQTSVVGGLGTQALAAGLTPTNLVRYLIGPDVVIANVQYRGTPLSGGIFQGGLGVVGFQTGIVLSTGRIQSVEGPLNVLDNTSSANAVPGDLELNAIVAPETTADATVLEFDFECPTTREISFQYVFASEEYNEFVGSPFNDVFAFFLNGQNIASLPGSGLTVAINNVNCGNPYVPSSSIPCGSYVNNSCADFPGQPGFPCLGNGMEPDGRTIVLTATGTLLPGPNHIKLAIADTGDPSYDSNVFIRSAGFSCAAAGGPSFEPPSPCGLHLAASVGVPFTFQVIGLATNGQPHQACWLSVAGSPPALAGGSFFPALPAGPVQPVQTTFTWTPTQADIGSHPLVFTLLDQIGQTSTCTVTVEVAECYLFLGRGEGSATETIAGLPWVTQMAAIRSHFPVTLTQMPSFPVPSYPVPVSFSAQVLMHNPLVFPQNPAQWSHRLRVTIDATGGVSAEPLGTLNGVHIGVEVFTDPSGVRRMRFPFTIDGM